MTNTEYLIITEKSNTFCNSITTFNKLLQVDSNIKISGGTIKFKDKFCCNYKITSGEISGKEQRYFHTQFSIESENEADLIEFSDFLKTIRTISSKVGSQPETLWDDISFHYSKIAYNIIHKTENLMRKLIANFMLVTIGIQWINETAPTEVKDVINKGKRKDYINVLHNVDFIHLADFLIKPYSNTPQSEINKLIKKAATIEDIAIIKSLLPESNWNRYFSSLVSCDDTFLQRRWADLYELRCKVAHNAIVSKLDFDQILILTNELEEKIKDALTKLPQVNVPETEVTSIAENAAQNTNTTLGEFISTWRALEYYIFKKAEELGRSSRTISEAEKYLCEIGVFDQQEAYFLKKIKYIKNIIAHSMEVEISEAEIRDAIKLMIYIINKITVPHI